MFTPVKLYWVNYQLEIQQIFLIDSMIMREFVPVRLRIQNSSEYLIVNQT